MPYVNLSGSQKATYYDGDAVGWISVFMPSVLMCLLTFGLAYPYARCFYLSWSTSCIVVEDQRLFFHGRWQDLYPIWLKNILLTMITGGIYAPWMISNIRRWEYSHISADDA